MRASSLTELALMSITRKATSRPAKSAKSTLSRCFGVKAKSRKWSTPRAPKMPMVRPSRIEAQRISRMPCSVSAWISPTVIWKPRKRWPRTLPVEFE